MRFVDLARVMAGGAAGTAIALSPDARADEPCARVTVRLGLGAAWTGALAELRRQVALVPAADCQPMTLSIEPSDGGARVIAVTVDGRRAERHVRHPESLVATALGLLMSIPTDVPPPAPAPPAVSAVPSSPAPVPAPPAVVAAAHPALGIWAGLATGVRLADPTNVAVLDVEARADLLIDRWLALASIRSAVASCLGKQGVDCDVYNDVSVGLGAGRRFRAGDAAVDVALAPSVVWMHMEYDAGTEASGGQGNEVALRLDASARLAVPLGDSWALTLTVDAGLAPSMLASPTRIQLPSGAGVVPPFPAWTGGVRIGASGALL